MSIIDYINRLRHHPEPAEPLTITLDSGLEFTFYPGDTNYVLAQEIEMLQRENYTLATKVVRGASLAGDLANYDKVREHILNDRAHAHCPLRALFPEED